MCTSEFHAMARRGVGRPVNGQGIYMGQPCPIEKLIVADTYRGIQYPNQEANIEHVLNSSFSLGACIRFKESTIQGTIESFNVCKFQQIIIIYIILAVIFLFL